MKLIYLVDIVLAFGGLLVCRLLLVNIMSMPDTPLGSVGWPYY